MKPLIEYQCEKCGWCTTKKSTFQNHLKRKKSCKTDIGVYNKVKIQRENRQENADENIPLLEKTDENIPLLENEIIEHIIANQCDKCMKICVHKSSLTQHKKTCKGVNSLTCEICKEQFTTHKLKFNHKKKNNCTAKSTTINGDKNININVEHLEQHIHIHLPNKINNFGEENIEHLKQIPMLAKLCDNIAKGDWSLFIQALYFNPKYPENHTVKYKNLRGNTGFVHEDGKYIPRNINNIIDDIITKCCDTTEQGIKAENYRYEPQCKQYERYKVKQKAGTLSEQEIENFPRCQNHVHTYNNVIGEYDKYCEAKEINQYIRDVKQDIVPVDPNIKEKINTYPSMFDMTDFPMKTIIRDEQKYAKHAIYKLTKETEKD